MDLLDKIIISIPFHSKNQFQAEIHEVMNLGYKIPMVEVRWDYYLEEITEDLVIWVKDLIHSCEMKTIFTYNHQVEPDRVTVLFRLISNSPDYIDLDVNIIASTLTELAEFACKKNVSIVYSYHNYEETPPLQVISGMWEFLIQMLPKFTSKVGHMLKMVFTAKDPHDVETILEFCKQYADQGFPLITFCMGEIGRITRIQSVKNNAAFTYAYFREPTAPGQVHISELQKD